MIEIHERYAGEVLALTPGEPEGLLRLLDEASASQGWDLPPGMWTVYRGDPDEGLAIINVEMPTPLRHLPFHAALPAFAQEAWSNPTIRAELVPAEEGSGEQRMLMHESYGLTVGPDDSPDLGPAGMRIAESTAVCTYTRNGNDKIDLLKGDTVTGSFPRAMRRLADLGARMQTVMARTGSRP